MAHAGQHLRCESVIIGISTQSQCGPEMTASLICMSDVILHPAR